MEGYRVERRYVFTGTLTLTSALHIGGRDASGQTASPIMRADGGRPFIPGSSLKGAFRSAVERLSGSIPGVTSCALTATATASCLTVAAGRQRAFARNATRGRRDADLLAEIESQLCDTCKLFGSPYRAGRLQFGDLYLQSDAKVRTRVRDGVAINRDSECAEPRLKYDYEVLESATAFPLRLVLENPTERDLQLTCVGLAEFRHGYIPLGGLRTRGLGRCVLGDLTIHALDLSDTRTAVDRLRDYLLASEHPTGAAGGGTEGAAERRAEDGMVQEADATAFLARHIDALFAAKDATHAQTIRQ